MSKASFVYHSSDILRQRHCKHPNEANSMIEALFMNMNYSLETIFAFSQFLEILIQSHIATKFTGDSRL